MELDFLFQFLPLLILLKLHITQNDFLEIIYFMNLICLINILNGIYQMF